MGSLVRATRGRVRLDLDVDPVRIARVVAAAARLRIARNIQAQISHVGGDAPHAHAQCEACAVIGEVNEHGTRLDALVDDLFRAQPDFYASVEGLP